MVVVSDHGPKLVGIPVDARVLARRVEKYFYTIRDAEWALGGPQVVRSLRAAGWLKPIGGKPILFTAESVAEAARRMSQEGLPD